jgi:hypothetical protein
MTERKYTEEEIREAARKISRDYYRKWRKKHPDKVKQYNDTYRRKKAVEYLEEKEKEEELQ